MIKVRFILTGGTIDKIQKAAEEKPVFRCDSKIIVENENVELDEQGYVDRFNALASPAARRTFLGQQFTVNSMAVIPHYLLNQLRINEEAVVMQRLMMMDSLEIEDEHRQEIVNAIIASPEDHIVITHGTSTMTETARFVHSFMASPEGREHKHKTVVFTGAMKPLSMVGSDGSANLGQAHTLAQKGASGVHIAMHLEDFDNPFNVRKDEENSRFVLIDEEKPPGLKEKKCPPYRRPTVPARTLYGPKPPFRGSKGRDDFSSGGGQAHEAS